MSLSQEDREFLEEIKGVVCGFNYGLSVNDKSAKRLLRIVEGLRKEVEEQCRLNGMGSEREAKLMTERDRLRGELKNARAVLSQVSEFIELVKKALP